MTTIKLNDDYDVTLAGPQKTGTGYEVSGTIWNRKTHKPTKIQVHGEGRTISSAQTKALQQARERCPSGSDE